MAALRLAIAEEVYGITWLADNCTTTCHSCTSKKEVLPLQQPSGHVGFDMRSSAIGSMGQQTTSNNGFALVQACESANLVVAKTMCGWCLPLQLPMDNRLTALIYLSQQECTRSTLAAVALSRSGDCAATAPMLQAQQGTLEQAWS